MQCMVVLTPCGYADRKKSRLISVVKLQHKVGLMVSSEKGIGLLMTSDRHVQLVLICDIYIHNMNPETAQTNLQHALEEQRRAKNWCGEVHSARVV